MSWRARLIPGGAAWLLAGGALLALAHPPFHLLLPSFLGLVPLALWLEGLPGRRGEGAPGGAAAEARRKETAEEVRRGGFFFGLVYFTLVLYWLAVALIWYTPLAILAFLAPVLILAWFTSLVAWAVHEARLRLGWPVWLGLPVFWTAMEWLRAHIPDVAFPWMQLGDTLTGFPVLIGAADLVGSRGLSFWLALVNGLVAAALVRWRPGWPRRIAARPPVAEGPASAGPPGQATEEAGSSRSAGEGPPNREVAPGSRGGRLGPALAALGLAIALPIGYSLFRWHTLELRPAATVGVVQPNVPEDIKLNRLVATDSAIVATERLLEPRTERWRDSAGVDLVALPESAIPLNIEGVPSAGYPARPGLETWVGRLARRLDVRVLYGALGYDDLGGGDYEYFNSAYLTDASGARTARYDKRRLVPIVERVPFVNPRWFAGLDYFGGFGVGRGTPVFPADDARFGVMICYESIYSDLARSYRREGADFLVNITNDAWFGRAEPWWSRTSALWQHPAHLVMRAVETRMGAARSANTGISFLVDPLGRTRHRTELFTEAAFVGEVATTEGRTLYVRFGDLVGWAAALAALAAVAGMALRGRRGPAGSEA